MILFKDHTAVELHALLAPLGVTERLARRLQAAIVHARGAGRRCRTPCRKRRRRHSLERIREATRIPRLTLLEKRSSPTDGFRKYLVRGDGDEP